MKSKIFIKPRYAGPAIGRHPWVFASAIQSIEGSPELGSLVELRKAEDKKFVAYGLYNPQSQIRVRLYSWDSVDDLSESRFWEARLERAIQLRLDTLGLPETSAFRAIFSEADELSGLTVDKFGEFLTLQFSSAALFLKRDLIAKKLKHLLTPAGLRIRTDRATTDKEGLRAHDEWIGREPTAPISIQSCGLEFAVDLRAGQKTGFYLDQRLNRERVAQMAAGRRVLDLFCYSGGFALSALQAGAASAIGVDSSAAAIQLAKENARRNKLSLGEFVEADVFEYLKAEATGAFGLVVVDPPRFVTKKEDLERGMRKYFKLNEEALKRVEPGGIFVSCSCSGLVSPDEFLACLAGVARRAGRAMQFLEVFGASPDHPVISSCPETNYLKVVVMRVN